MAKLNFVVALVESIVELAQSRSSPITESVDQRQGNTFRLDHASFVSEGQRQLEQLVLYVRALQLLSSSIELAREEVKVARLQPSNTVKTSKDLSIWILSYPYRLLATPVCISISTLVFQKFDVNSILI